jgi:hypothetical protein
MGSQAYWVSNNTFYVADAVDGEVITETAKPVEVQSMSKLDVEKMLLTKRLMQTKTNLLFGQAD